MNNKPAIASFDKHAAALLNALGYECRRYEANWQDIGGPESGPEIVGNPAFQSWERLREDGTAIDCIIVVDGVVVDTEVIPAGPEGWEENF